MISSASLLVLLLLLAPIGGGVLLSYAYDARASLLSRLFSGTLTGMLLWGLLGLALGLVRGLDIGTILLSALIAALPLAGLVRADLRAHLHADCASAGQALIAAFRQPSLLGLAMVAAALAAAAGLWLVFAQVMVENAGGISTGWVNNLGDLPFHFSLITSFAYGANLPAQDPMFAGTTLTYPFLADYFSAMLLSAGMTLRESLFVPNFLLGVSVVGLMARWTYGLTRSRGAAALAPLLLLLGGGLGWLMLADDARLSGQGALAALLNPTHDYTIVGDSIWRWGNAISTLLVTQRSLLLGLPVALLAFILLWQSLAQPADPGWRGPRTRGLLMAGLLTGSLAIVHTHSLLVVLGTAFLVGLLFREWRGGRWRSWLFYLLGVALLAAPGILLLTVGSTANVASFFGFELGWDHGQTNPIVFWLADTGLFIPLLLIGLLAGRVPGLRSRLIAERTTVLFLLPFAVWFLVPNLFKLAPWIWDNVKVLFYWWVGFVPLVALVLARWWGRSAAPGRVLVIGALAVLLLAGTTDVWRGISGQVNYAEYDHDGLALAAAIRADTPPDALILAAPTWNPPLALSGRRSLLGYPGQVWSRGFSYTARQADITTIYAGGPTALALLHAYGFSFVEVSPLERGLMKVSDSFFATMHLVAASGDYQLYEVPK